MHGGSSIRVEDYVCARPRVLGGAEAAWGRPRSRENNGPSPESRDGSSADDELLAVVVRGPAAWTRRRCRRGVLPDGWTGLLRLARRGPDSRRVAVASGGDHGSPFRGEAGRCVTRRHRHSTGRRCAVDHHNPALRSRCRRVPHLLRTRHKLGPPRGGVSELHRNTARLLGHTSYRRPGLGGAREYRILSNQLGVPAAEVLAAWERTANLVLVHEQLTSS